MPSVLPAAQTASTPPMSAADVAFLAATAAEAAAEGAAADGAAADGAAALGAAALAGAEDAPLLEHAANSSAVIPSRETKRVFLFCTRASSNEGLVSAEPRTARSAARGLLHTRRPVGAGSSPFTGQAFGRFPGPRTRALTRRLTVMGVSIRVRKFPLH